MPEKSMNYSFTVPSLLILLVIMGYYFFRPRVPIRQNRAFLAILVIDIFTVLFDYVANRLNETWPEHAPWLLWMFYMLYFVFYLTRIYMFFVFTISVLDARGSIRARLSVLSPIVYVPSIALTLSSLLFVSASYTPLPGASGAQEGGFLYYFRNIFSGGTVGLALLTWRFFTYYITLFVGVITLLLEKCIRRRKTCSGPENGTGPVPSSEDSGPVAGM